MRTVVQIGAGAVGRGFLGQLWTEAGYEVVFVDVDRAIVDALNERGSYPLRLIDNDREQRFTIGPVRAVYAYDVPAVAEAIATSAFVATAVGARRMQQLGYELIAPGLVARARRNGGPLNILLCENGDAVREHLREGVVTALGERADGIAGPERFATLSTSVERAAPESRLAQGDDPLLVRAEPYRRLPVDTSAWLDSREILAAIDGVETFEADLFLLHKKRKLYLHNGGHALLAYQGYLRGYAELEECARDPALVAELRGFWGEINAAFARRGGASAFVGELDGYTGELLERFRNQLLGDTVARIARDPARKLAAHERLVGAANFCLDNGIEPEHAIGTIAAALRYDAPDDAGAQLVQAAIRRDGVREAFREISGLPQASPLLDRVQKQFI